MREAEQLQRVRAQLVGDEQTEIVIVAVGRRPCDRRHQREGQGTREYYGSSHELLLRLLNAAISWAAGANRGELVWLMRDVEVTSSQRVQERACGRRRSNPRGMIGGRGGRAG